MAVKLLSTKRDINVTNATVANAAAKSSRITAKANKPLEGPAQAKTENKILVAAIAIPAMIKVFTIPDLIAIAPPIRVKTIVVIQPKALEKIAISPYEKPISLKKTRLILPKNSSPILNKKTKANMAIPILTPLFLKKLLRGFAKTLFK